MKLYTNNKGQWAGTQADAKKLGSFDLVEVPTDKPTLLQFLNEYQVGASDAISAQMEMVQQQPRHPMSCSVNDLNGYDVNDVVLNCRKDHLGQALASIISRLHDELGEAA
jgi:hypothetical protein